MKKMTGNGGSYCFAPFVLILIMLLGFAGSGAGAALAADETGSVAGQVTDAETALPIKGAWVAVEGVETFAPVLTDENGKFSFTSVPAGQRTVSAGGQGYISAAQEVIVVPGQTVRADFALQPARPGAIEGYVYKALSSHIEPIPGAYVFYSRLTRTTDTASVFALDSITPPPPGCVRTDSRGHYIIKPLPADAYVLIAWAPGFLSRHHTLHLGPGQAARVNFALPAEPSPPPPGSIEGQATDRVTGRPIAGAFIYYHPAPDPVETPDGVDDSAAVWPYVKTDENGKYRIAPLRPGRYLLTARAANYYPLHLCAEVRAGETTVVNFKLEPAPVPPGSIAGKVVNAVTGVPIAGAWVFYGPLFSDALPPQWTGSMASAAQAPYVRTDENGKYAIDSLKPGIYYLLVRAEGFVPQSRPVKVASGQVTPADFKLLPAPPHDGAIAGRVTNADSLAPIAPPIPGARVYYHRLPEAAAEADERAEAIDLSTSASLSSPPCVETDENGFYKIPDLAPGRWHLLCAAAGFRPEGRVVKVAAGLVTIADFALHVQPPQTGSVYGKVIDAATQLPIAKAAVWVVPDGPITITAAAVVYGYTYTDEHGNYRIDKIPAGKVMVLAFKEHYRTGRAPAEVKPGLATLVNFALQPVIPQKGDLAGTVKDKITSQPLERALVILFPDHQAEFDLSRPPSAAEGSIFTWTDGNGQYAFKGIPAGPYQVWALKGGYLPAMQRVTIIGGQVARADFGLQPIFPPPYGSLSGRVVDAATSAPLAGAWVCIRADQLNWLARSDALSTRTNEAGYYRFPRVRAGQYDVTAIKPLYHPQTLPAVIRPQENTELNFALAPIPQSGAIEGNVRDALTQEPIAGALVFVPLFDGLFMANPDNCLYDITDDLGHYRIEQVPPGQRIVVAMKPGYFDDAQLAMVTAGQTTTLDYYLIPWPGGRVLQVRAVDSTSSAPLGGARIRVVTNPWADPFGAWDDAWGQTAPDGWVSIANLPPGAMTVVAQLPGYTPVVAQLPADGSAMVLSLDLESTPSAAQDWVEYP